MCIAFLSLIIFITSLICVPYNNTTVPYLNRNMLKYIFVQVEGDVATNLEEGTVCGGGPGLNTCILFRHCIGHIHIPKVPLDSVHFMVLISCLGILQLILLTVHV